MNTFRIFVLLLSTAVFAKDPVDMLAPYLTSDMITFQPQAEYSRFELVVVGPDQYIHRQNFDGDHLPFFEIYDLEGALLSDGVYRFELRALALIDDHLKIAIRQARAAGDDTRIQELRDQMPKGSVFAGSFQVRDGAIVLRDRDTPIESSNPLATRHVIENGFFAMGAATPSVNLHIVDGDSPGLRLEQNDSLGLDPQDWDIVGNDTSFFIRDTTNLNTVPFRINTTAPANAIFVDTDGDVGLNTGTPSAPLHVLRNDGSSAIMVEDTSGDVGVTIKTTATTTSNATLALDSSASNDGTAAITVDGGHASLYLKSTSSMQANRTMLTLENEGGPVLALRNNAANAGSGMVWNITAQGDNNLSINNTVNSGIEFFLTETGGLKSKSRIFTGSGFGNDWVVEANGSNELEFDYAANAGVEVTIANNGQITANGVVLTSDVNLKENFEEVSIQDILARLMDMDITQWNFISEGDDVRHLGPMAQDFHAAFGLGDSDTGINSTDANGVAFASIKALRNLVAEKEARIQSLEARLAALEAKLQD